MKNMNNIFQSLTLILQFGLNMIVPIFMCTMFGIWIGRKYDILWVTIPFFLLGALAGFNSIYKMAKKVWQQKNERGNRNVKKTK